MYFRIPSTLSCRAGSLRITSTSHLRIARTAHTLSLANRTHAHTHAVYLRHFHALDIANSSELVKKLNINGSLDRICDTIFGSVVLICASAITITCIVCYSKRATHARSTLPPLLGLARFLTPLNERVRYNTTGINTFAFTYPGCPWRNGPLVASASEGVE